MNTTKGKIQTKILASLPLLEYIGRVAISWAVLWSIADLFQRHDFTPLGLRISAIIIMIWMLQPIIKQGLERSIENDTTNKSRSIQTNNRTIRRHTNTSATNNRKTP